MDPVIKFFLQLGKRIVRPKGERSSAKPQGARSSNGACSPGRSFEGTDACLDSPECDQREVLLSQGSLVSSGSEGYGSTMSLSFESDGSFELQPHLLQSSNAESQCKAVPSLQDKETLRNDRFDTLSPAQLPPDGGQVSTCKYASSTTCSHNSGYSPFSEQPASLPGGFSSSLCPESDCSCKPQPHHPLPTNMDAAFEGQHRVGQSLHDRGTVYNTSHSLSSVQPPPPSSREGTPCACGDYNSNGSPPPAPPILPPDACSCSSLGYDSGGSHEQLSTPPDLSEVPVGAFSSSDKPPPYSDHPVETMFYDALSSSSCLLFGVEISEEVLGRGSYGVVHVATYVHQRVAAKSCHAILQPSQRIMRRFADECELLSRIKHPSIVQFLGVHMDPDTHEPYIVMELMEGGTLYQLIDSLPSPQPLFLHKKLEIVTDIALALVYLHEVHNVVHRDLSSTNVLLTKDLKAKISDLGVARPFHHYMHNEPTTVVPGCQLYMPPEALDGTFTKKSDVFSLGVLMVEVFGEHHPRPSTHHRRVDGDIFQRVSEVERRKHDIQLLEEKLQDAQGQVAQGMIDLVYQCLENDPDDRPDTNDTVSRLARLQRGEDDTSFQPNTAVQNSHLTHSTVEAPLPRKLFKQKARPCRQHHSIPASSQTEGSAAVVHGGIVQPSFSFSEASELEAIESEESAQATTENPSNESSHSTSELLVPTTESQNQTDGKSEMVTNYSSTPSHSSDSLRLHGNTLSPATVTEVSRTTVHTEEGKQVHMTTNDATQATMPENTVNDISELEETNDNLCTESDSLFDYSMLPFHADSKSADDEHHMAVVKHTCSNNNSSPSQGDLPVRSTLQVSEVSSRTSLTRTWKITYLCTSYPPGISQFILVLTTGTYSVIVVQTVLGSSSITVMAFVPTALVIQDVLTCCSTCLLLTLYLEYVCSRLSSCSLLPSSRSRHDGSILRTETPISFSPCFDEMFVLAGRSSYSPFFKLDVLSRGVSTFSVQTLQKIFTCELSISPEGYHHMILFRNKNSIKESFALSSTPLALGYQNAVLLPLQHIIPQTFCLDKSASQLEPSQYKTRMASFPPAMSPSIQSAQDNVMLQNSSTAPPPLALDSARSVVLSNPTALTLKPQLPVLIPPLISCFAFAIARLLLHAQPMQFKVAMKYLSPEESQDEKKSSSYSSYRVVVLDWQYRQRKRNCSTVFPSVFPLKQQPLLVNPCNEKQLNSSAKLASFASFTETSPNQQMLPSALFPSCSQSKLVPSELESFSSNKGFIFLLYSKLSEHGFVSCAFVFSNSTIIQSCETIAHLCLVHITCQSASSPEYGLGIVVKSKYNAPVTLLITLLPTRSLPKTIHSVSPFIPQATLVVCSNGLLKTASSLHEPMAMVPGKTTTHESTTLISVPQLSSQTIQPIPASERSISLTFTNTSYGGGEVCTCTPHSSMADLVCATGKVAQIHVFTRPLQGLHCFGLVGAVYMLLNVCTQPLQVLHYCGAACVLLQTMQWAACYQRVIWCVSNSLPFLKLAKSLSSQGTVVYGTLSPNQPEISACPVAIGQESQLTYHTAESSSVQDTLSCLPTSKPSLLASHKNMRTITRPCTTTTTLGKEEEHQPPPQPLLLGMNYETSTQTMTATSSSVANLPLYHQNVLLYSPPNLQHVPQETLHQPKDLLPNMKVIPHVSQQYPQPILALLKYVATMLGVMFNVDATFGCKLQGLEELLVPRDFKPSPFDTGSAINPASKEFSYITEALHCLLTTLHSTNSTSACNNMMQDANRNHPCMNNLHLRWLFSNMLKLHMAFHNLCISKSSVGNTPPLECPFVPQIPTGYTSNAIHLHNYNQLTPGVVTTRHLSACFLYKGITFPKYKFLNLPKREQVSHPSLSAKPHLTTNHQATCTLFSSACPARLKHHTDNNSLSHMSSIPDGVAKSCEKLVTLTPSTAQCPIQKHVHMNTASPPSENIPTIRQKRLIREERLIDAANTIHGKGRNDHLCGKQRPIVLEFPHPVYKLPLDMEDPLHKSPPVDLMAKGRIVSSPHSQDQKDSRKDGTGQGQGSGGSDGSPPSGGDRGGENGGGPPSSSGNGRRDDDNEKDRAPDRKKDDDNYEEVNEGDEEGEEDEDDAQTPHSGDWQSKRCTGPRQHSAHFFNGQELPLQQPQPDDRAERRVYDQGVGPMDHSLSESTPGRLPKSTYGTPRKKQDSNQQEDNHNDAEDAPNSDISDGQSKQNGQELPSQQLKANDGVGGVLHHQTTDTTTHTPSDNNQNEDEKHPANAHRAKQEKPVDTQILEGNPHGTLTSSHHPYPTETTNPHSTDAVDPSESNTSLGISSRRKRNPAVQQGCGSSNTVPNNALHSEEPCSPDNSQNEGVTYHPTSSKNGESSAGKVFQSQQSVNVDSLGLLDDPIPAPLQEGASNSEQNPQTTGSKDRHPSSHHQPQVTASLPSSEVPSLQLPVVNGTQTTTQPPVADDELQNGQPEVAGSQGDENQALGETSLGVIHTESHIQSDGIEDDHSSANLLPQDVPPDNHEPDDDSSTSAELLPTPSQSLGSDQSQDEHNLGVAYDGCSDQSSILESVCPEVDETQPVDQFVSNNTTQSVDTGQLYTDFVTNTTVKPSTWSFPTSVQGLQYRQGAIYKPFNAAHSEMTTHESCEYDDTSPEACNSCSCTPIQESLHVGIARLRQELLQHGIRLVYECENISGFPLLVYLKQCVRQGHNHLVANALLLIVKCFTICRCWDTSFFLDCDAVTMNVETCEVVVDVARCIEPGGDSTEHTIGKLGILIRQLLYENICSSQNAANGPTESLLRSVLAILNWYYSTKDLTIITERLVTELMQHKYK